MKRRSALREDMLDDDEVTPPSQPAPLFASPHGLCPFAISLGVGSLRTPRTARARREQWYDASSQTHGARTAREPSLGCAPPAVPPCADGRVHRRADGRV